MTPVKNLSPVSLTPVNNLYFPGAVDTVQKKTKKPKMCTGVNDIIFRWCQRHRRLESPANISLPTPKNEKIKQNFNL
jgi:hypothetical protein